MAALSAAVALAFASSARAAGPFYEETFNNCATGIEMKNGAAGGGPGSGVSGQVLDTSYEAPQAVPDTPGPLARILADLPSEPLEEFTVTAWYRTPQSPLSGNIFNTRGSVLSCDGDQWTLRVNDSTDSGSGEKRYSSGQGLTTGANEWQFIAVTWSRAENAAQFFSGGKTRASEMVVESRLSGTAPPLGFGDPTFPRAIGNTYARQADGSFPGNIDNVRMFSRVLEPGQIEEIRKADVSNKPAPSLP